MSYNFVYNEAFIISTTISTNIQGDGFNPSDSNLEYSASLFKMKILIRFLTTYQDFMEKVLEIAYFLTASYIIHSLNPMELCQTT